MCFCNSTIVNSGHILVWQKGFTASETALRWNNELTGIAIRAVIAARAAEPDVEADGIAHAVSAATTTTEDGDDVTGGGESRARAQPGLPDRHTTPLPLDKAVAAVHDGDVAPPPHTPPTKSWLRTATTSPHITATSPQSV
jgi:hypothetical protein